MPGVPDGEQATSLPDDRVLSLLSRAENQLRKAITLAKAGKHGPVIKCLHAMDELVVLAVLAIPPDAAHPYRTLLALLDRIIGAASPAQGLELPLGEPIRTRRRKPSKKVQEAIQHLRRVADAIGPREPGFVFDPAAFRTIAHVIATALFAQPSQSLSDVPDELGPACTPFSTLAHCPTMRQSAAKPSQYTLAARFLTSTMPSRHGNRGSHFHRDLTNTERLS